MHPSWTFLLAVASATGAACSSPTGATGATTGGELDAAGFTTFEVSIGPISVPAGAEETRCILVRLGNPDGVFVRRFRTDLGDSSHHFIVYRSSATREQLAPAPCPGFGGISLGEPPIFIAQHATSELVFPSDGATPVGLELEPDQMLRLEMHWLNASGRDKVITGTASVDTVPLTTEVVKSDLAFWGTTHLNAGGDPPGDVIPAGGTGDTGVMFQAGPGGTRIFALTTHQHRLGTRMRVWKAASPGDTGQLLADSTDWATPALEHFDPPIELPASERRDQMSDGGLSYRCEWNNTTAIPVGFGESAVEHEMCFLWHHYYPARGFGYCLDGTCR